jgi:pimeloyl-ACP methyl ester carboxylesterase
MGYDTQRNLNPFSTTGLLETLNYQTNVFHAFQTAPALAAFIASLNSTSIVAAHSLGNMVVLSALNDYGANVSAYFMVDAAAAIETIDGNVGVNTDMVHPQWTPYDDKTWASDWYQLFSTNDYRTQLNWTGRFGNINVSQVYNFYSSGEEVLRTSAGSPPSVLAAVFDQVVAYGIFNQAPVGSFAWAWQEKSKGRCAGNWIMGSNHGGWGFNNLYGNTLIPPSASTVNALTTLQLQANPVFDVSYDGPALYGTNGSAYAQIYRNRILSDAIPALTLPVGANPVTSIDQPANPHNFDMQADYENGWPQGYNPRAVGASAPGEWHHSDFKVVAYTYTHGLFDKIVTLGNLK